MLTISLNKSLNIILGFNLCWLLFLLTGCQSDPLPPPMERMVTVVTAPVAEQDTPIYLETIGNISAPQMVQIKAQIEGKLHAIYVGEGQDVTQGDLLFEIEPHRYQAGLARVEALTKKNAVSLEFARNKFSRHEILAEKEYVSKLNYEQYASDVELYQAQALIDQAELDLARLDLDYCTIRAPITGKVSQYNLTPGNLVSPNDAIPLIEIKQITPIYVNFYLSQEEFQQFKNRQVSDSTLRVLLPHQEEGGYEGQVFFIDNQFDLSSGSILLKGQLPNDDRNLWPGEFVKVRLLVRMIPNAKLVPLAAVQLGQQGEYIYVVRPDMRVELRQVKSLGRFEHHAIFDKGIEKGEVVVIDGQISLHEGALVKIKQDEDHESL